MDTRKAMALLAYLAVNGGQQGRDSLAALLWPENDQTSARAALRRTLSVLNKALAPGVLTITRESVEISANASLWFDVEEFQRSRKECASHGHAPNEACPRCLAPLEQAAGLYQDTFMAGFTLRDSPAFDDWQFFQSESLRRELVEVLECLAHGYALQGHYEQAIAHARRRLAQDPLHEPAHRQLMQLYAWSGRRSSALRQYQECARILERELGVSPLEETTRLYEEIKDQQLAPLAPTPDQPWHVSHAPRPLHPADDRSITPGEYPLVGRGIEWSLLQQAYSAVDADGRLAVLEGEAGIGKTRLAEEFISHLREQGAHVLAARCYQGESGLALATFLEALRSGLEQVRSSQWHVPLHDQWLNEAARLLPDLAHLRPGLQSAAPSQDGGAQMRFFEGVHQVLRAMCSGQAPGMLFFDDLQWADETSLDLLTYLVRRLGRWPTLILLAWRSEDLPQTARLRRLLAEAQRNDRATLVTLARLSAENVNELVSMASGGAVAPVAIGRHLFQETEGLPYFLTEYLAALPEIVAGDEQGEWDIPQGVRDLLHARLEQVGEAGRQLLQTAATIGRSFDIDILRSASGRSDEETVETLEILIRLNLIREAQLAAGGLSADTPRGWVYDFTHNKVRSLIYTETSLARHRLLHQRVADALAARARGRPQGRALAGQIAYHYRQAGNAGEAAIFFFQAGEHARSLYANAEALAHFQAALALGYPEIGSLDEAIGDLYTLMGNYPAALNSYAGALAPLGASANQNARLEHKLGSVYHRLGEWGLAESHYQAALQALEEDSETARQARLFADWSHTALRRGHPDLAIEMANQALNLAEKTGDPLAQAQAHNTLGILARGYSDLQTAIRHLEYSLALADKSGEASARIAALNNLSLAFADGGDLDHALQNAHQALELCRQQGDRHREAALHNNLADFYHVAGQEERSMQHLKQAVVIFAEIGASEGERSRAEIWKLSEW